MHENRLLLLVDIFGWREAIVANKVETCLRVVNGLAMAVGVPAVSISLLASPATEMSSKSDSEISGLANTLLRLLVTARENPQRSLPLDGDRS